MVHEKFIDHARRGTSDVASDTDQPMIHSDLTQAIEKGIALLPEKTQQVFKLSRFENCTNKEISNAFNISEKAVEYHITQSLKQMRGHLKDYLAYFFVLGVSCLDF